MAAIGDILKITQMSASKESRQLGKQIAKAQTSYRSSTSVNKMMPGERAERLAELRRRYRSESDYLSSSKSNFKSSKNYFSEEAKAQRASVGKSQVDKFNRRASQQKANRNPDEIKREYRTKASQERKSIREERMEKNRARVIEETNSALNGVTVKNKFLGRMGSTGRTLANSAYSNLSEPGNLKNAGKRIVQTAALGAGSSAGIAYLQGDDPWQAAKTGAFRGAMAGAGYQGLKAATHTERSLLKGGAKDIAKGVRDTFRAHTNTGNAALRQSGMSNQLKRVLEANQSVRMGESIFGLNGK
ncbi:hypothetical protein [Bacillus subtilis]|uniref:hypothetical protein n=1 Tax=Bacillus subtilis TaxID=1423 RepID=UPI0021DB3707|nr:hypothetical protein [Bacillus subtilis]